MRIIHSVLVASFLFPAIAWGGQISGTLFRNGHPVANEEVRIRCGQDIAQAVKTDSQGRFTFFVRQTGTCDFEITRTGATLKDKVYFDELVRQLLS